MKKVLVGLGCSIAALFSAPASALIGYADEVVAYSDSGMGPIPGPYGGLNGTLGAFPVAVPVSVVIGSDSPGNETFLSLPTGSFVTVRFTDEVVLDGAGNDIFIQEVGVGGERAEVYVSSDGLLFTLLGIAQDDVTTALDLASIGFTGTVSYVKIVGLDNGGGSPGFDVVNVQGLPGSIQPIPEPELLSILGLGLFGLAAARRARH